MKRAIIPISFPSMKGDEAAEVDFELSEPGEIVDCIIQVKPLAGAISIVSATNAPPKPQFEFTPTAMVFVDPEAPARKRSFLVAPIFRVVESEGGGDIVYRGRFLFPDGHILFLYEEIKTTAPA